MPLSLHEVQLQRAWLRKWSVVIYPLHLAQLQVQPTRRPESYLPFCSLPTLLSTSNIFTPSILWQKFKEKFYNGSLCFDSGSNREGPQDWEWSLSWLCQMKQTPQSLDWFRLESLAVSSKSLKLRIGCIIVKKW